MLPKIAASLFIAAFALWPALVSQLVVYCHTDPWKLGGWGMYSDASNRVDVDIYAYDQTGQIVLSANDLPGTLRVMIEEFEGRRRVLGCMADPLPLATYVFERYQPATEVVVAVGLVKFNARSDFFEPLPQQYTIKRSDIGQGQK